MIFFVNQKGYVIMEALVAVGLTALFLGSIGTVFSFTSNGSFKVHKSEQADLLARDGLEVLRTIDFNDLGLTNVGHPTFAAPSWSVAAGSETVDDFFTRSVRIRAVERDGDCNVVSTGGTVDPDSKFIESVVSWTDTLSRVHTTTLTSLKTRWNDPQGDCFKPEAASNLIFHVETTLWYGGKQLRELFLENGGSNPITITYLTFTWSNGEKIQQTFLNSTKLWSASGPGTPSGTQSSGTRLDILDYTIPSGVTYDMGKTQFDGAMAGTTLTLTIEFSDGSIFVSPPFTPL